MYLTLPLFLSRQWGEAYLSILRSYPFFPKHIRSGECIDIKNSSAEDWLAIPLLIVIMTYEEDTVTILNWPQLS